MKVSLIIPSFYPAVVYGGPIFSTLFTARYLSKIDNVSVYVSTTNANKDSKLDVVKDEWIKLEQDLSVKYYDETIVGKLSISFIFNVLKDIKNSDVVHVQSIFSLSTFISLFYSKLLKKCVLLSSRGQLSFWAISNGSTFKKFWLYALIKPLVSNVIWHATSNEEKNDILTHFPKARVKIISNGIEFARFQYSSSSLTPSHFAKKFANVDCFTDKIIVSIGRLHPVKGFDILIYSFLDVLSVHPDAKLFIAGGDDGEEARLNRLINELRLINKVFLIGVIEGQNKVDFLANADVFALPSHSENFGNVYIESLASGTPVVASTNTPWSVVERLNCGKWVPNTVKDTSEGILEILSCDRELTRQNSKVLAKKYDWSNISMEFKNLFEEMVRS